MRPIPILAEGCTPRTCVPKRLVFCRENTARSGTEFLARCLQQKRPLKAENPPPNDLKSHISTSPTSCALQTLLTVQQFNTKHDLVHIPRRIHDLNITVSFRRIAKILLLQKRFTIMRSSLTAVKYITLVSHFFN